MAEMTPNKVEIEVYLEGVKVPISSVSITEVLGSPPSCQINFPAHSGALRILPGTLVHVFGLVEMLPGLGKTKKISRQKVLLFEGEIAGQSYDKTPSSKTISLIAQSLLHKWSKVYMHSSDILSDRLFFSALYVYQNWNDLKDSEGNNDKTIQGPPSEIDEEGTPIDIEIPIQPKVDGENKYLRFNYNNTLEGITDLENFVFTAWGGESADTAARDRGDWMPFFIDLIRHLEYLNLYYGMFSKMYRLADTNFVFPNVAVKEAFLQFIKYKVLLQTPTGMADQIAMLDILIQILGMINYVMLIPSAPTYTVHPYTKKIAFPNNGTGDFGEVPMRTFMLPDMKFSVPASCNVIFPDEVERINFTRNMAGEYTRLFCGASPTELKVDSENITDLVPYYIAPGLPILLAKDDEKKRRSKMGGDNYILGFTPEETYRGVHPLSTNFNGLEYGFLQSIVKSPGDTSSDESAIAKLWSPITELGAVAFNTAVLSFYNSRYSSRQCSITANWNPFRIVGLPALFFDLDGSPSVMGTLSQHTVTFDSAGVAKSEMVLGLPRVFYDIEGLDMVDHILPSNVNIPKSKEKRTIEQMDSEVLKHNAMEADPIPWVPGWYDEKWYGHNYVGRDVYSIISAGTRSLWTNPIDTVAKEDSAWTNTNVSPEPSFPEDVREKYNSTAGWSYKVDYSIFEFIRNTATAKFDIPDDMDADLAPITGDSAEAVVAKRIAYAVRELKRQYYEAKENGRLKNFMINTTNRNLTPKISYWKFIGIGLNSEVEDPFDGISNSGWRSYYAPTIKEGAYKDYVLGVSPNNCKDILHKFYDNDLTWQTAINKYTLHPFVEKRRDHVLTMTTLVGQAEPKAVK